MKPSRQWVLYTVLRFGVFAVVLAGLLALQVNPFLAAVIAAAIGLCVTYIFFRPQRDAVVSSFADFRTSEHRDADSDAENDALDSVTPGAKQPRSADVAAVSETDRAANAAPADAASSEAAQAAASLEGQRGGETDAEQKGREAR
ncbi:MAG: DUF4229 domain-containing protein [Burkholderiaceae bacterium]|nr:DUF4229 domain-containing protein [Microbacteriaceae bacterium]